MNFSFQWVCFWALEFPLFKAVLSQSRFSNYSFIKTIFLELFEHFVIADLKTNWANIWTQLELGFIDFFFFFLSMVTILCVLACLVIFVQKPDIVENTMCRLWVLSYNLEYFRYCYCCFIRQLICLESNWRLCLPCNVCLLITPFISSDFQLLSI